MSDETVIAIFKLGKKAHMAELLHEGHVFMNTVSYFADLEDGSPRSDRDEGMGYCQQADDAILKMQHEGEWRTVGKLRGEIRVRDQDLATANLYSLHARRRSQYGALLELDRLGFGDSYVCFLDANEFFRRLKNVAAQAGHKLDYATVNYVDRRTYSGSIGVFRKFSERAADSELRVAVLPGTGCPLSLYLGDLSDIAMMGSTSERLRLDPKLQTNQRLEPVAQQLSLKRRSSIR